MKTFPRAKTDDLHHGRYPSDDLSKTVVANLNVIEIETHVGNVSDLAFAHPNKLMHCDFWRRQDYQVFAINSLYAALGFPPLSGWVLVGGDPCTEAWQGVLCVNANITGISLNGAKLGGELGASLDSFASIISIDLSNNHIGGTIPSNLPPTIKTLILSGNQFSGSLPDGLSALSQLTDLLFSNNNITRQIPDSFQQLIGLINLDLSC